MRPALRLAPSMLVAAQQITWGLMSTEKDTRPLGCFRCIG